MRWLLILSLIACKSAVPNTPPDYRDSYEELKAAVTIKSVCDGVEHTASGVILSERHILTAAHAVSCAYIPVVHARLYNGDVHRLYVIEESSRQDLAKLEVAHAGLFGVYLAPPLLETEWFPFQETDYACVYPGSGGFSCAMRLRRYVYGDRLNHGDSGSAVYDNGMLVGLVSKDLPEINATQLTPVDSHWLEGTW